MKKTKKLALFFLILCSLVAVRYFQLVSVGNNVTPTQFWSIRSIDVMKYSRDLAREKLNDQSFDETIESQISRIASTGATHVALGVPYDVEFLPIMRRWVSTARKYHLKIWFRGNLSGWEGWFEYPKIDRNTHLTLIKEFIINNTDLFEDGDLFSSCPECENGGDGDPRQTGKITEYRQFLIDETDVVRFSMRKIGRNLETNLHSMNGDVAKLIMDKETTRRLGGIVVIDHYVATADQLVRDIKAIAAISGGNVILGEFGAPIPDIHGNMTEGEQADWIGSVLEGLSKDPEIIGLNYWTGFGGSTELWNDDGSDRLAVGTVTGYFSPAQAKIQVLTWFDIPVRNASVYLGRFGTNTEKSGYFSLPLQKNATVEVAKAGFLSPASQVPTSQKIYLPPISWVQFLRYFVFGI